MKIRLTKKQHQLSMNILSVLFIATILYAILSFLLQYNLSINKFIASSDFVTIMVLGILSYVGYEIMSGKRKIRIKKQTKTHRNTPKKQKRPKNTNTTPTPKKQRRGTARCPQCYHLIVGTYCPRCRVTWSEDELKD